MSKIDRNDPCPKCDQLKITDVGGGGPPPAATSLPYENKAAKRLPLHLLALQKAVRLICHLMLSSSLEMSDEDAAALSSYMKEGF